MSYLEQAKFDSNLLRFVFRLLHILRKQLEIGRLGAKTEAKYILYFTFETYDNLNQIPVDLQIKTKINNKENFIMKD